MQVILLFFHLEFLLYHFYSLEIDVLSVVKLWFLFPEDKERMAGKKKEVVKIKPGVKKNSKSKHFPVVAIGASAGGIEAFTSLLQALPPDTGMAYVYIQYPDPTHKSMLTSILSRHTKMKVVKAKHLLSLKANHVFIIPPDKNMAVLDGVLTLNPGESSSAPQISIDTFFTSLAEKRSNGAIGIVLSGNTNDGTLGLRSIKAAGGFTFAQDNSAKFQSMPKSAIAEGVVDMVLPPEKIAEELTRISQNKNFIHKLYSEEDINTEIDTIDLAAIIELLRKGTGTDFTHYKVNTIQRRIIRRMLLLKFETLKEYGKYLKQHSNEVHLLYNDLLINVTCFFRDQDALEYVKKTILPKIIKPKRANESLRIWVPACSTGEEAYSLAMILHEILGENLSSLSIQIFASDLSDAAIHKARIGLYSKSDLSGISPRRLQRFFTKADNGYRIIKSIRDLCVFAPHNVLRDPPFSRLDMISCCNLMIYLDNTLQKKMLHIFHYSLNQTGYLILGKSETISTAGELFNQIEKKYKVYSRKKESANRARFELKFPAPDLESKVLSKPALVKQSAAKGNQLEKTIDDILLRKYTPASVVVNEDLEILQFRGSTGLYLEPSPGKASLNLLKMAKPGLAFELRNAVHKSRKALTLIRKSGIEIKIKGHIQLVDVEVLPLKFNSDEQLFLVVFEEAVQSIPAETKSSLTRDKMISQLEHELEASKEDMRSMLEEQEAQVEELQSANEEIVSSNEELQSINEELETSKEEIESANEELVTINNELLTSNEQLFEAKEYAEAVFDTIREAVILLDKNFRVTNANKSFYRIFNVNEHDTEGTLIYELGNREWDTYKLRQLLEEVIPKNSFIQGFEVDNEFPKIGHKIMLLNARRIQKNNGQFGILLAIEDITEHRHSQLLLQERESWFRNMSNHAPVLIWVAGTQKTKNFFNNTWLEYTGREHNEEKGNNWKKEIHIDDLPHYIEIFNRHFDLRLPFQCEYRLKRADGIYRWILDVARPTFSQEGIFTGYIGSCIEIHDRKLMLEEFEHLVKQRTSDLQETNEALQRSNSELQQFAYVASHDLQEPLRKILTFADRLQNSNEELPAPALSFINKISNSSEKMRKLIDELLNFSRVTSSDHQFVRTDLESVFESVLSDFELTIIEKKAQIHHNPFPSVDAVPIQMKQLLHNMISNGLKFARNDVPPVIHITSGTPDVKELNAYGLERPVPYIKMVFADNGIGFSSEYSEQIFDIFHRLNHKQDYPGTGIGLALCRRIASNHGGKIIARGTENKGAEFHVFLPASQPAEKEPIY